MLYIGDLGKLARAVQAEETHARLWAATRPSRPLIWPGQRVVEAGHGRRRRGCPTARVCAGRPVDDRVVRGR